MFCRASARATISTMSHYPRRCLLRFDVGCSDVLMLDVPPRISRGPLFPRCRTTHAGRLLRFDVGCSDVLMLDVPPPSRAGRYVHDVALPTPVPSSLRCWMFRCSDVGCSAAHLARATISTMSHSPRPCLLPFDVGCSDVLMLDVPPRISRRPPLRQRLAIRWLSGTPCGRSIRRLCSARSRACGHSTS